MLKSVPCQLVIVISLCVGLLLMAGNVLAGSGGAQWTALIDMAPGQTNDAEFLRAEIAATSPAKGVRASVRDGRLALSGSGDLEYMRSALFDDTSGLIDFLGGPIELTLTLPAGNQPITLELESRPTTGYRWEVLPTKGARYSQREDAQFKTRYAGMGAPAIQTIELAPQGKGAGTVHLVYRRAFEPDTPIHARVTLKLSVSDGLIELTDPTPTERRLNQSVPPSGKQAVASQLPLLKGALPAAYDSRTLGIVPAVRNQGACGSCWAFGTVGVMEIAVKKSTGAMKDFSEQFLISCNLNDWDCNGGLTASQYHYNTLGIAQTAAGAVLESVRPYLTVNGSCDQAYAHPNRASSWQYITGSEWTVPPNDQIKNAIMTYGAVTAGVCADVGWYDYTGGVYNPASNRCGGETDHQIVLVGWNDATQSWILRNSWGSNWGEKGYMRIKYDPTGKTSRVGEGASWIRVDAASGVPTAPAGLAAIARSPNQIMLKWQDKSSNEANFKIERKIGVNGSWKQIATVRANTTNYVTNFTANTIYRVRAGNAAGHSVYSNVTNTRRDLVVTKIVLTPANPKVGTAFKATVTVKNQGLSSGSGGWLDVWTHQTSAPRCGTEGIRYRPVGTLGVGASKTLIFSGLMAARTPGNKTFRAFVDSFCQIPESRKGNNHGGLVYRVQ